MPQLRSPVVVIALGVPLMVGLVSPLAGNRAFQIVVLICSAVFIAAVVYRLYLSRGERRDDGTGPGPSRDSK